MPTLFVAVTVNVYGVPLVSPSIVQDSAPVVEQVRVPGVPVTVYRVIAEPLLAAAVQDTRAEALNGVAWTPVGENGIPAGVTLFDAEDAGPVPIPFVALTVNV